MDVYFRSCPRDVRVTTSSFGILSQCFSMSGVIPRRTGVRLVPQRDPQRGARSLGLAPKKNAFRSALQLSGPRSRRNPRPQTPPTTSASTTTNPISFPWIQKPTSKRLSNSWPATATSKKGMGLMALTWRRPAEIFFSASFSLPQKKLPYPALLFDGQLKTRQAPGTSSEPYLIPVLGRPQETCSSPRMLSDR
jgi:hypothetical protein